MKINSKSGIKKRRNTSQSGLPDLHNNYQQFFGMVSQLNADFFNRIYENKGNENLLSNVLGSYKYVNNLANVFATAPKTESVNKLEKWNTMPANGHDIYNYSSRFGIANFQLQAVMKLDERLDYEKLTEAVMLSVEEQPVFGCHFIEAEPPYWKPVENIHAAMFCTMEETQDPERSIRNFLEISLDMDKDPMVKVRLIRSEWADTLCLKINHACCDGAGMKEYIKLLAQIYSALVGENGRFLPKPCKRSRSAQDMLFSQLGISDPEAEWIPGSEITKATWPFPWQPAQSEGFYIVTCRLTREQLDDMVCYSRAKGATINDLILTAYFRAMSSMGQCIYDEPMEISVTIDLRRYLPDRRTDGIRNFSGSEMVRLTLLPGESYNETLARIVPLMNEIKNNRPGLQSTIGLERLEKMPLCSTIDYYKMVSKWPTVCGDKCAPVLSNLGYISGDLLKFGDSTVTDAYIIPPVVQAPGFLLLVSTYNGIMTLAAGYYENSVQDKQIEVLIEKIRDELVEGCKQ